MVGNDGGRGSIVAQKKQKEAISIKKGYSEDLIDNLYALGRFFLENGETTRGLVILKAISKIAPDFVPAWLALAYAYTVNDESEQALRCAKEAYRLEPASAVAILFLVTCLLNVGDIATAGSYLGEAGELIEREGLEKRDILRYYKGELYRYRMMAES